MKGDTYLQFEIKPDNMLLFILKKKISLSSWNLPILPLIKHILTLFYSYSLNSSECEPKGFWLLGLELVTELSVSVLS